MAGAAIDELVPRVIDVDPPIGIVGFGLRTERKVGALNEVVSIREGNFIGHGDSPCQIGQDERNGAVTNLVV